MHTVRITNRLSVLMIIISVFTLLTVFISLLISASSHALSVKDLANTVFSKSQIQRPAIIGTSSAETAATIAAGSQVTPSSQAALQANTTTGSVVAYPSARIDATQRDQLYTIALSVIIIGLSIYGMTLFRTVPQGSMPLSTRRRPLYNANATAQR